MIGQAEVTLVPCLRLPWSRLRIVVMTSVVKHRNRYLPVYRSFSRILKIPYGILCYFWRWVCAEFHCNL